MTINLIIFFPPKVFSMVESVNKYIVKSNEGHIIYGATEGSSHWQRLLCGTARRFILRLFDRTHQEAVYFIRRLAPTNPLLSCYLQVKFISFILRNVL